MNNFIVFDAISSLIKHRLSDGLIATKGDSLFYLKSHNDLESSIKQHQIETKVLSSLSSSTNILSCLGIYEGGGDRVFLVFPYIKDSLISYVGKIDDNILIEQILIPILEALSKIHECGFIHADLKLENIRIDNKSFLQPCISDFGKSCDKKDFSANQLGSLAQHIPPDMTISPQFDIYSLGVIAFQMLFGFDFIKKFQMNGRDFDKIPEADHINKKLLTFIKKATEVSARDRFKSCDMALAHLVSFPQSNTPDIESYNMENYFEFYIECLRDTFITSKRSTLDFENFIGPWGEKYFKRLNKWKREGAHLVHLKLNNDLIGVCEASIDKSNRGIISLIYLKPKYRGKNLAATLEESAINYFRDHKVKTAVLNVTASNMRAIQFYLKNGWCESSEQTYPGALQFIKNI